MINTLVRCDVDKTGSCSSSREFTEEEGKGNFHKMIMDPLYTEGWTNKRISGVYYLLCPSHRDYNGAVVQVQLSAVAPG